MIVVLPKHIYGMECRIIPEEVLRSTLTSPPPDSKPAPSPHRRGDEQTSSQDPHVGEAKCGSKSPFPPKFLLKSRHKHGQTDIVCP